MLSTMAEVGSVDFPLPVLGEDESDRAKLAYEQLADKSLEKQRILAGKLEKGYQYERGLLVHYSVDCLGDSVQRIVVPIGRRASILKIGHSDVCSGHFGVKKTFGKLSKHFLWPGMWRDVKAYVKSCAGCQKGARNTNSRAPLQPLPCISEPFQKCAFDLVGPLPKTHGGHRYILTMMCLYTNYPEAIALRRVDNESILDAMVEIFSRHGIPQTILTDQGSVFMSRLTKQLCELLKVKQVRTSPYHPQSRGGGSGTASTAMAVPIFEANNYGCGILWVCFLMSMRSVKRGLITE